MAEFEDYVRATSEPLEDRTRIPSAAATFERTALEYGVEVVGTADDLF